MSGDPRMDEEVMSQQMEGEPMSFEGRIELGHFTVEDEKSDEIWVRGLEVDKAEKFHFPHIRDFLQAAATHDRNGLSLEEFMMGFILMKASEEEGGEAYRAMAGKVQEVVDADHALKEKLAKKMNPAHMELEKILKAAGMQ